MEVQAIIIRDTEQRCRRDIGNNVSSNNRILDVIGSYAVIKKILTHQLDFVTIKLHSGNVKTIR